jgi:hypothetical protein
MKTLKQSGYKNLDVFFGDLHNHCGMSYGRGSLMDAIQNARLQLDFASVTLHAAWPDLPTDDPNLVYLVDYHNSGFSKARNNWHSYLNTIDEVNEEGSFITFPSYEWHSSQFGDYCIYFKDCGKCPILDAGSLPELRESLRSNPTPAILIPHHIGYKLGWRGINWQAYSNQLSPVVEIFSFHGLSERSDGPYPYLHSMGPLDDQSSAQTGWSQGHVFGIIGSTDNHNAFPGSYGQGRMGVWAESLSREAIWQAINKRRTYALTGDRIELAYTLNGSLMGDICQADEERHIEVSISSGSTIDYIDVLHNNKVIHRENVFNHSETSKNRFKVFFEVGWSEDKDPNEWNVELKVESGKLLLVEPRFRGFGPIYTAEKNEVAYSNLKRLDENRVQFSTQTRKNPSVQTSATEGVALEIEAAGSTRLIAHLNGKVFEHSISELITGARSHYLSGFVSPAICFHRAVPYGEYCQEFNFQHTNESPQTRDWYYIRVRQRNNQWAWSSPIWVNK